MENGANKSIDGRISTNLHGDLFHSNEEPFPWLEIELEKERWITGLFVVNRYHFAERLKDLEIRVGNEAVPDGHAGQQLTTNVVAGHFTGPGVAGETYEITFGTPVKGKFISLQLLNTGYLQINEVFLLGGELG